LQHIFGSHGRDVDRQIGAQRCETKLEAALEVEEFAVVDQLLAAQDHSDNLDVLAGTLYRFLKGYAVPVFDDVRS